MGLVGAIMFRLIEVLIWLLYVHLYNKGKLLRGHAILLFDKVSVVAANHENDTCFGNGLVMGSADCIN